MNTSLVRLQVTTYISLICMAVIIAVLAPFSSININTLEVRSSLWNSFIYLAVAIAWAGLTAKIPKAHLTPAAQQIIALGRDLTQLQFIYKTLPLLNTIAVYLIAPYGRNFADWWLSWPESIFGLTHPVTYRFMESWSLLPILQFFYDSVWNQVWVLLAWCLLRRDLSRVWEFIAGLSASGVAALGIFWAFPAAGPWTHYGYAAPPQPLPFLADLLALRDGSYTVLKSVQPMMTIPSYHTVFAILLVWVYRGHPLLFTLALIWNACMILSIIPVGWHYWTDIFAGAIWAWGIIRFVDWVKKDRLPKAT